MRVIVCIDDRGGMLFNNRRVSRDALLIEDMARDLNGGVLSISAFSEKLLANSGIRLNVDERFLDICADDGVCFAEGAPLLPYANKIDELVIYKWNRSYPSDVKLDIDPKKHGFKLVSSIDFVGKAHEKITKEIFKK